MGRKFLAGVIAPTQNPDPPTRRYVDSAAKTYFPVCNGTHFNGNGGATSTSLIQTRCRQTRKLLRVIGAGATELQVEWANIWTSNTPQGGGTSELAGPNSVTARMAIEYPAGNVRIVSGSSTYAAGTAYALLDQVVSAGIKYVCIQAGTGNTPASSPTFWRVVNTYVVTWEQQSDTSGTVTFPAGAYYRSQPIPLLEQTQQGDLLAILGAFDTGSSSNYVPYAGSSGASNTAPFVDWVVDAAGGLPAIGSALPDTGVTNQTNGNTTTASSVDQPSWMHIPFATAVTGNIPVKRCIALLGDSLMVSGDIRDGEPCGLFPRSIDGASWWRIAQGGNRAGCYTGSNAPWQMSVVARCTALVTNLCMNDINANLTFAQVQAAVIKAWKMFAATGTPVYAGFPTPISASTDAWATTTNQSRYIAGGVNTTQNPNDDATYLTSVYGLTAMWMSQDGGVLTLTDGTSVKVGQAGHPIDQFLDWRGLMADPVTSWKWNAGYTTDGAHPTGTAAIVQSAYTAPSMEPVLMGRQQPASPLPIYSPHGEAPVGVFSRSLVSILSSGVSTGSIMGVIGVSSGRYYYGFRCWPGTAAGSRSWTLLAGADAAKLKVIASGTFTTVASTLQDTAIPGAPMWIPAGWTVALVLTTPAASSWGGATAIAAGLNKAGLGFLIAGTSADTAVLTGVINLFSASKFTVGAFRPWAELY